MALPSKQDHVTDLPVPLLFHSIPSELRLEHSPVDIYISAHASPLLEGRYTVWVLIKNVLTQVIQRYDFSLIELGSFSLGQIIFQPDVQLKVVPKDWLNGKILYTGHAVISSNQHLSHTIVRPLAKCLSAGPTPVVPANPPLQLSVAPWQKVKNINFSFSFVISIPHAQSKLKLESHIIPLRLVPRLRHMSAYSGVLTFCQGNNIVIEYYD
jgi:hypothetical protein